MRTVALVLGSLSLAACAGGRSNANDVVTDDATPAIDSATSDVADDSPAAIDAPPADESIDATPARDVADASASPDASDVTADARDLSGPVVFTLSGSAQNPCWSPTSDALLFTRFQTSYNTGLSDLGLVPAIGGSATLVTSAAAQNVNLPGSCWNAVTNLVVYSSDDVDRDEVWLIPPSGGTATRVTNRPGAVAYEPSLSPDGVWIVFESHPDGVATQGSIWKVRADGTGLVQLTDGSGDDREPNWSPTGSAFVFQSMRSGNWDIWTIDADGNNAVNVTNSPYEDTDPSWSPDGMRIVYSTDEGSLLHSALFVIGASGDTPVRVRPTSTDYEGAPSWSPDGRWIAFETYPGDPDGSPGTTLAIAAAPP